MRLREGIADIRFRTLLDDEGGDGPDRRAPQRLEPGDGTIRWTIPLDGDASSRTAPEQHSSSRETPART